jgi:transcriptional regulator with XRE-family HTH domain
MRGSTANGPNIRRQRKRLGLTQEELAGRAEVDVKTVRNAEANRSLDAGTLQRIALALSVELSYIAVTSSDSDRQARRRIRVVQQWIEAFNRQDVESMLIIYHDDAELSFPFGGEMPGGGTFKGKQQLRRQAEKSFACFQTDPFTEQSVRIHCAGDFVFLRGSVTVTVKATGASFTAELMHEFQFNDDKVTRHTGLFDTASMFKAFHDDSSHADEAQGKS